MRRLIACCLGASAVCVPSLALAQGASARLAYDTANLALNDGNGYQTADNKTGTLAWGESYVMMSYAAMYRATSEPSYLINLASHARSVLERRDSVLGWNDYKGKSRPCWQSTKYSDNGEPFCWVVHSGMITYPMADLARIVGEDPALQSIPVPWGGTLGDTAQQILTEVLKTVATHEFEWKEGPGTGEGHYIGDPGAPVVSVAGKALPLNQMNALGMTLAALADTGNADAEHKAKGMCAYLRHRMTANGAAMVWTYWGDAWTSGKGEDISHAALNVEFASLCRARSWSFTDADMVRIARTLFDKVHIDTDHSWDRVDATGSTNTYHVAVGRWLTVAPYEPRVWAVGANAYRKTDSSPSGADLHALSLVAQHAPPVRAHTFYHVDWNDLGDYRKATAYGANILMDPPSPAQRYAIKLRYKAGRVTGAEQWDGQKYHPNVRLAIASAMDTGWLPYDPAIYLAYSGTSALFQFEDDFVAGQGVEVQEAAEVVLPSITTQALPGGSVGQEWSATLAGAGDPPLLWSLVKAPPGMTIGLQSGELAWTPSSADAVPLTVKLRNDSGSVTRDYTVTLTSSSDAGAPDGSSNDASSSVDGAAGTGGSAGSDSGQPGTDGAPAPDAQADGSPPWNGSASDEGCSCRTGAAASRGAIGWLVVAAIALVRARKR